MADIAPKKALPLQFWSLIRRKPRAPCKITGHAFTSLSDLGGNTCFRRSHQELPLLRGEQRDRSIPFLHPSSREVCFYRLHLFMHSHQIVLNNGFVLVIISVWENKSTSYFALSFPHRALQALEERV